MSTAITQGDAPVAAASPPPPKRRAVRASSVLVYLSPVAMFVILTLTTPGVLSTTGVMSLLVLASVLGLAAVGQTWAVMIGGIDLSIPATIGMANVLVTTLYAEGWGFGRIVLLVAVVSIAIGAANGLLSSLFGLHPLVVTLGMASLVTGSVLVATDGNTGGDVPGFVTDAVSPVGSLWGIGVPAAVVLWLLTLAVVLAVERRTVFGRRLYALGSNERAARLALVRPVVVRVVVYSVGALCASAAGLLLAGFSGGASVSIGDPYLFSTITAVVVGGTSLLGGAGTYARTVAGVLVTTMFTTLLVGLEIGPNMQQVMLGIAILLLITVYGRDRHVAQRL
ncbi:ABC transporter permease [Nocardioides lijunqiniae]|uniref:ABC transporter permease n=1 Tax=Nocardioides lijunqiniae TaxID=2760832 RepID=UPI00187800D0|nr:ABC transporter permease [Nocardioides lijunqiniae]